MSYPVTAQQPGVDAVQVSVMEPAWGVAVRLVGAGGGNGDVLGRLLVLGAGVRAGATAAPAGFRRSPVPASRAAANVTATASRRRGRARGIGRSAMRSTMRRTIDTCQR